MIIARGNRSSASRRNPRHVHAEQHALSLVESRAPHSSEILAEAGAQASVRTEAQRAAVVVHLLIVDVVDEESGDDIERFSLVEVERSPVTV